MEHNSLYTVCIQCFTYNQDTYIIDALDGFVAQKTTFPFVAVVVDDASTDNEPQVIHDYFYKYFDVSNSSVAYQKEREFGTVLFGQHDSNKNCYFAMVFLKENHYRQKKSKLPYLSQWLGSSRYIAFCEGDDYWTDPLKLQKQVDYLESHSDCMLSVHSANWRTGEEIFQCGCKESFPKEYSVNELIRCGGYYFATASFVFRSVLQNDWPEWRRKADVGDFPLQILAGLRGVVHYHPDIMCVYRYRSDGSWSSIQQNKDANIAFQKRKIEWMTLLDDATEHQYQRAIYSQLLPHFNSLLHLREIGFVCYARAFFKSGQKKYGRLVRDFLKVYIKPAFSSPRGIK